MGLGDYVSCTKAKLRLQKNFACKEISLAKKLCLPEAKNLVCKGAKLRLHEQKLRLQRTKGFAFPLK
jgi:hypothetical protein